MKMSKMIFLHRKTKLYYKPVSAISTICNEMEEMKKVSFKQEMQIKCYNKISQA